MRYINSKIIKISNLEVKNMVKIKDLIIKRKKLEKDFANNESNLLIDKYAKTGEFNLKVVDSNNEGIILFKEKVVYL